MKKQAKQIVGYLREKPVETRKHILTLSMIGVGVVLALIWIATLRIATPKPERSPVITEDDVRPFELLKDNFVSSYQSVSAGIRGLKQDISSDESGAITPEATPAPAEPITATGDAQAMAPSGEQAPQQ